MSKDGTAALTAAVGVLGLSTVAFLASFIGLAVKENQAAPAAPVGETLAAVAKVPVPNTTARLLRLRGRLDYEENPNHNPTPSCAILSFDWDSNNPYTYERQNDGQSPFSLPPGCEETQRCLFMPDDMTFNVIAAGGAVFPTFENVLSDRSPSVDEVLGNSRIVYDDKSIMYIEGIGKYKGPAGIGEYRIIPQSIMENGLEELSRYVASPSSFSVDMDIVSQESWHQLDRVQTTKWTQRWWYYPCSVIRKREELQFPTDTAIAFSDTGMINGMVDAVCQVVMEHCTGPEPKQYNSTNDCISFLSSLPHHDTTCQKKFGQYTAMGNSFMCKYLHHFMVPLEPETHCAHVGMGQLPGADGSYKCVAADCNEEKPVKSIYKSQIEPTCSEKDIEELVQGIIYTLPFCLPSLEMQVCLPKCTQAINTYLGRFSESGVIDSCNRQEVIRSSRLLSLIHVDAPILYHICSGDPLLLSNDSSFIEDISAFPTCGGVNQYLGSGLRCLGWDWERVSQGMFHEWTTKYKSKRTTQSDDIASAECYVFTRLYTQYLNIQENQIVDHASNLMQSDYIQIHPNGNPLVLSHDQIAMAFEQKQIRDSLAGRTLGHCSIPGKAAHWMQNKPFVAIAHDTDSDSHKLAREFVFTALKGLKTKPVPPPARNDVFDQQGFLDTDELFLVLAQECFRALLGSEHDTNSFWTENVIDDIRTLVKAARSWFYPESWHRAQGYLLGVGYASKRQAVARRLKNVFSQEEMKSLLPPTNNSSDHHLLERYDAMVDILSSIPLALVKMTRDIVVFVRNDPCWLLPLWEKSPERFIIEYARVHAPVGGFVTDAEASSSTMGKRYQIASANRDPEVFPNPLAFDPERDLSQALSWNFIESKGQGSHARSCPGRSFSVQFVASHAKRYFPSDVTCANNMKVYNGVELFEDDTNFGRVLKTSSDGNTLFLFLHGFPDVPQEFAPIISHLQGLLSLADYWILDGWSAKGSCQKFATYAEQVANFISECKLKLKYEKIFIVGHDLGGFVGWKVAERLPKDILSGLISFAPRPQIFGKSLSMISAKKVYFFNLMKPLIGATFLASNDFQMLNDLMSNETFWPEFHDEYHRMWSDVGAHRLTCVYRENFGVVDGSIMLADLEEEKSIETDILIIGGEDDAYFPKMLYHASMGIKPQRGQQMYHKEIYGASHHGVLHEHAKETAQYVAMFAKSLDMKGLSMWSHITKPPEANSSYNEEVSSDTTTLYIYVLTLVVMLTGLIMEVTIGPALVGNMRYRVFLFAQVMAATINFGCFFAANLITLPLYVLGLFKMGYPEVTSHIRGPLDHPALYFNNKPFRVLSFCSGIAYLLHHSGATLLYLVTSLHEMNPLSLGFVALAVGFQHLVVFVKYCYPHLYTFLLLCLELWFQLESFYAITFSTTTARVGIYMLLISHYIWLIHGFFELILILRLRDDSRAVDVETEGETEDEPLASSKHRSMRIFRRVSLENIPEVANNEDELPSW